MHATGTCHRCGRFLCIRCVPELLGGAVKPTCSDCGLRAELLEAETKAPRLRLGLIISQSLVVLLALAVGAVLIGSRMSEKWPSASGLGVVSVLIGLGVGGANVMFARSRDVSWVWVALALMLVPPVAALILSDGAIGCGIFYALFLIRQAWAAIKLQGYLRVLREAAERKVVQPPAIAGSGA